MTKPGWLLGVDGGGTKCLAVLADLDGRPLARAAAGPANAFTNTTQAQASIVEAADAVLAQVGQGPEAKSRLLAGVGLAGVNVPEVMARMNAWQHPFADAVFCSDLHIACLGAHAGRPGAVMVMGTGSCGYAWDGSTTRMLGGHGFPHGDVGSGAWFGLQGVHHVLRALDDLGPQTALSPALLRHAGAKNALDLVAQLGGAGPADYGRFAPLVLAHAESGDAICQAIVREGARYLSAMAMTLQGERGMPLALLGGLAQRLLPWLNPKISARLTPAQAGADIGALRFAQSQGQQTPTTREPA